MLLSPLINQLLNTQNQSGGFGFRVFGNGLAPINSWASIGAELGFSYYPQTTQNQNLNLSGLSATFGGSLQRNIKTTAYGTDLLLDLAFQPWCSSLVFSVKPGFQFAYQANKTNLGLNITTVDSTTGVPTTLAYSTNANYKNTAFLPQIILSMDVKGLIDLCWKKNWLSMVGITYQHVFGNDDTTVDKRIASRNMIGLDLGIFF